MCVSVKYHLLHLRLNDLSVELLKTHLSYILRELEASQQVIWMTGIYLFCLLPKFKLLIRGCLLDRS